MPNGKRLVIFTLMILFILSSMFYYLPRKEIILVWNEMPYAIQIEKEDLSPRPNKARHPNLVTTHHYYHAFDFPVKKYLYSYFDFFIFHRYTELMKGVQFNVRYQGRLYRLGCPASYKNNRLHLAIISPRRKGKGLLAICMPMKVHRFLNRFPAHHHHNLLAAQQGRLQMSKPNQRIAIFETHKVGVIQPRS